VNVDREGWGVAVYHSHVRGEHEGDGRGGGGRGCRAARRSVSDSSTKHCPIKIKNLVLLNDFPRSDRALGNVRQEATPGFTGQTSPVFRRCSRGRARRTPGRPFRRFNVPRTARESTFSPRPLLGFPSTLPPCNPGIPPTIDPTTAAAAAAAAPAGHRRRAHPDPPRYPRSMSSETR